MLRLPPSAEGAQHTVVGGVVCLTQAAPASDGVNPPLAPMPGSNSGQPTEHEADTVPPGKGGYGPWRGGEGASGPGDPASSHSQLPA